MFFTATQHEITMTPLGLSFPCGTSFTGGQMYISGLNHDGNPWYKDMMTR